MMHRSTAGATIRTLCLVASTTLWTAMTAPVALSAQSHDAPPHGPTPPSRQQAQAPEGSSGEPDGWSYGARGMVSVLRQESLGTGFGVSGFAVFPLNARLDLEGEVGFVTMNAQANGLPAGRLSVLPLRATLRVHIWRFDGADVYAGGGVGVYVNRFSVDEAAQRDLAELGFAATASVDPALGLHAAAGIEWRRGRIRFGADVKYAVAEAGAPSTIIDLVSDQRFSETSALDLDGLWIAAGVRFGF